MTTGNIPVNPAVSPTEYVPTYTFTEDSITKNLERVALNESDGSDTALAAKLGVTNETAPGSDTGASGLNGRLQRIAQRLTTLIADMGSFVFGAGTAAAAQRVTLASDDPAVTNIGPTNETAPASDTGASGLNGRLQRIAQRLTTLITNLAFVFGAGTAAAAQRVTLASDDPGVTNIGPTNETAPASDTGASGLNGRLQRVAQRLTTLITAVGTQVYGAGTAAAAERVTLASDDPAVATLGATSGAAVITDASGTIQQYLRGLIKQWIAGTLVLGTSSNVIGHVVVDSGAITATSGSAAYSAVVTITRTADTNVYTAGDVVGAATGSTAAQTFTSMGPSGGIVEIVSASLEIDATALLSGETSYRLYLYNVTPPGALGDNAAWDLSSGDRASFLGYIDLGTPVDLGSTLYVRQDNIGTRIKLSGTSIFAYLVCNGTTATNTSGRVFVLTLHTQAP